MIQSSDGSVSRAKLCRELLCLRFPLGFTFDRAGVLRPPVVGLLAEPNLIAPVYLDHANGHAAMIGRERLCVQQGARPIPK